jgi:putative DNA primase/helicase
MLWPANDITTAFLRYVLPEHGYYVAAIKNKDGQFKRPIFAETREELAEKLKYWDSRGLNTFFAAATFKEARLNDRKAPKTEKIWGRTQSNVRAIKVFALDFDEVGEGKFYKDWDAVYTAVLGFCRKYQLPNPIFVGSGRGVHVYWVLLVEIDPITWKRYATGLKNLCREFGLRVDPVVTANSAAVLRAPGTHNHKYQNKPPVEIDPKFLQRPFCALDQLAAFDEASSPTAPGHATKKTGTRTPKLLTHAGIPGDFPPSYAAKIADHCLQLQRMRDTGGQIEEPTWYNCFGVMAFCQDGKKYAHEWSAGDKRYDAAQTQAKFEQWHASASGPTTCQKFHADNPNVCEQCQYFGKIKSPIELGVMLPGQLEAETESAAESGPDHKFKELAELIKQLPEDKRRLLDFEPTNKGNSYKPNSYINAACAIAVFDIKGSHDIFHDTKIITADGFSEKFGPKLSDAICRAVCAKGARVFRADFGLEKYRQALETACEANQFDPICDYLARLRWDGAPRLDLWLTTYCGAEDELLHRAFGRKTLIAAVRRARQPGCKFDHMLIFEARQRAGKSTVFKILAGGDDNFSDLPILHENSQKQQELLAGRWFYEVAELQGIKRTDIDVLKAFLSRTNDRGRGAYGRFVKDQPRRNIFAGTTNDNAEYLRDPSGGSRFWPVKVDVVSPINLDALARDRDQLFAEAVVYEAKGESLIIPKELWPAAAVAQEARLMQDPWEDILAGVQGEIVNIDGQSWEERISTTEVLEIHLKLPTIHLTDFIAKRAATAMRKVGWRGPKVMKLKECRNGVTIVTKRGFWRPSSEPSK